MVRWSVPILDLMTPDHAYFFGFLQTDGHHSGDSRPGGQRGRISVEVSTVDDEILRRFQDLVRPLNSTISYRNRVTNFGPNSSATWVACDLGLRRELRALGLPVGRKSDDVRPPSVPCSDRDYLRGLVDGDGSVGFTAKGWPFVSFVTRSSALAEYFCAHIQAVTGAVRRPRRNARDGVFNPMIANDAAAELAAWLYPPSCLALERKRAAATGVGAWVRPASMGARFTSQFWTDGEDAVIRAGGTQRELAARLGRTEQSVNMRRWRLRNGTVQSPLAS